MRQLRFFTPLSPDKPSLVTGQEYDLPESTARHLIRVLRLREGAIITLFTGNNVEYTAQLIGATKKSVTVRVLSQEKVDRESPLTTHLIQSLSRGSKMETTIQKAVELGVSIITPVSSERSNVSLAGAKFETKREKKMQHWQGVIHSACEQTGRNKLPELQQLTSLTAALDACKASNALKLILSPYVELALPEVPKTKERPRHVVILIGPEGGLSAVEVDYARACGFIAVKAGPRVLRTETAGPAILSMVQMLWGDTR